MRTGWVQPVAQVLRVQSKSYAPILFARLNCSAAHQLQTWTPRIWMYRRTGAESNYAIPLRFERRQNQMQRTPATTSAIQLTAMGMVCAPTVTCARLISRRTCAIAKIPKRTLATRNPVVGEFMRRIVMIEARFVSKNSARSGSPSPERCGMNHHPNDCQAQKYNG